MKSASVGRNILRNAQGLVLVLVLVAMLLVLMVSRDAVPRIPQTSQNATPSSIPEGTRQIPWAIRDNSYISTSLTPPAGYTPPPFSYIFTQEEAIVTAMSRLRRTQYTAAFARRTTSNQIQEFLNRARPAGLSVGLQMPTATMPSMDDDYSSVVWVVVVQLSDQYSKFESVSALGIPVYVPTAGPNASAQDFNTYGNLVCVVLDEMGNLKRIKILDSHMSGYPARQPDQTMSDFAVLGEVGPSMTPTP